ncbi:MAG: hypothetical protein QXS07_00540, partial [Candidatus Pacearchaeota archaeon]
MAGKIKKTLEALLFAGILGGIGMGCAVKKPIVRLGRDKITLTIPYKGDANKEIPVNGCYIIKLDFSKGEVIDQKEIPCEQYQQPATTSFFPNGATAARVISEYAKVAVETPEGREEKRYENVTVQPVQPEKQKPAQSVQPQTPAQPCYQAPTQPAQQLPCIVNCPQCPPCPQCPSCPPCPTPEAKFYVPSKPKQREKPKP